MNKLLAVIGLMFLFCNDLFARSIGYSSVYSGFWWGALAIIIALVSSVIIIDRIVFTIANDIDDLAWIAILILVILGSILGFFMFPTIWCGALGALLGLLNGLFFICNRKTLLLIFVFTVLLEIFAFFLSIDWCENWKYFAIAGIGLALQFFLKCQWEDIDRRISLEKLRKHICPKCGSEFKDRMKFCPRCNASLEVKED